MPGGVLEILGQVIDGYDQPIAWLSSEPRTLFQFDSRVANVMFSKSPENPATLKFIDFGSLSVGKAAGEIPYMESTAFSLENRRAYEPDLMRIYHDALLEAGGKDYGWDQFTTDFRWGQFKYPLILLWTMGLMGTNLEDGFVEDRFPKTAALIDWGCGDLIN